MPGFPHKGAEVREPPWRYVPLTIDEGMTVGELRERLKRFPDKALVAGKFDDVGAFIRFAVKVTDA